MRPCCIRKWMWARARRERDEAAPHDDLTVPTLLSDEPDLEACSLDDSALPTLHSYRLSSLMRGTRVPSEVYLWSQGA